MNLNYNDEVSPGDVIAVGDIHGRYDLLDKLLQTLKNTEAIVIFLGDIIDRGGQDIQVVERVRKLTEDPESEGLSGCFCLMGNHEDLFIKAVEKGSEELKLWLRNGGNFEQYAELQDHLDWFKDLPIFLTVGETLFVHAGLVPGKDPRQTIERGDYKQLLWIREPFLSFGPRFQSWNPGLNQVVFGHTPEGFQPYEIEDGVCIDTGAVYTDVLTAYNATVNTYFQTSA